MAKGEETYSSAGKTVQRFVNTPVAKGDYQLTLQEKGLGIRRSKEKGPDAIPYIAARFTAGGTGKDGGKDRLVFHNFFLSTKPGTDGVIMPERQGGIVEFLRANGQELTGIGLKTITKEDGTTEKYLDAEALLEMLKEMTDTTTEGHVTIESGRTPDEDKNKVSYWKGADGEEDAEPEAPKAPANGAAKSKLPAKKK